jgi:UPF0716 family protein affecting phage T7 exclusion
MTEILTFLQEISLQKLIVIVITILVGAYLFRKELGQKITDSVITKSTVQYKPNKLILFSIVIVVIAILLTILFIL